MASNSSIDFHAEKLFQMYLLDYLIKRGMLKTAEIFQTESELCKDPIEIIDVPNGLLYQSWSAMLSMELKHQETEPESSRKVPKITYHARKNTRQMSTSKQRTQQLQVSSSFNKTMGPPAACLLPSIMYNEEHIRFLAKDADQSLLPNPINAIANRLKFLAGTGSNHPLQDIGKQVQMQVCRDSGNGLASDVTRDPRDVLLRTIQPLDVPHETIGISFEVRGCLRSSKSELLSCHFSSDGKFLASAGHEKKVFIWNMETFDCVTTSEAHSLLVTEVRFKPDSTIFATSSFDQTVKIWDAATPTKSLFNLTGHAGQVMSLDFHPEHVHILCSCDSNDIIRMWDVNQCVCLNTTKGGSKQVRFQPPLGKVLATATGNYIKIFNTETGDVLKHLKGHVKEVLSICWDKSGYKIASVSEDRARVWSPVSGGKCIHELHSNGNKFQSCIFHPGSTNLLIIGGYESLVLWSLTESGQTWTIPAHKGLITGLAISPPCEWIASASLDHCVKLWE